MSRSNNMYAILSEILQLVQLFQTLVKDKVANSD